MINSKIVIKKMWTNRILVEKLNKKVPLLWLLNNNMMADIITGITKIRLLRAYVVSPII